MSKSEDRKVQSKMRSRQSISRNHGKKSKREEVRTVTGIEAQTRGERAQLECKPKHKTNDKDQDKRRQAQLLHLTNIARSAFLASAGV